MSRLLSPSVLLGLQKIVLNGCLLQSVNFRALIHGDYEFAVSMESCGKERLLKFLGYPVLRFIDRNYA